VYEYIEGTRVSSEEITEADIEMAVEFLARLKRLQRKPASRRCPEASEACFSIQAIMEQLQERLARFPSSKDSTQEHLKVLQAFLREAFLPAWRQISIWCQARLQARGIPLTLELREEDRTLSPSDFGFHNAIRRPDGRLVFVDFEYFGWDDPAKLIVDFLFHPAMELPQDLKRSFVTQCLRRFDDQGALVYRVEVVYPLWGLKWCLILLNEFLPADRLRRGFAQGSPNGHREIYERQLAKARQMLQQVMEDYARIPYLL
jgi:thiamine kinase-like enzyme